MASEAKAEEKTESDAVSGAAARRTRAASPGAATKNTGESKTSGSEQSQSKQEVPWSVGVFDFVTCQDVENLRHHKFVSAGSTPVDDLMQPFWCSLARCVPRCISPNMISVVGGVFAAAASVSSVIATRCESRALYFVAPVLLFVYMTADAIDGKHARDTNQSTPLGAVVDHGVDAFISFTTGVAVVNVVDTELSTARIMLGYCLFHTAWFCAQWYEWELGSLDQRGITESEFITMFLFCLPGLISFDVMDWTSPVLPVVGVIQLRYAIEIGVIVASGTLSLVFLFKIIKAASGRRLLACLPFFHMCFHTIVAVFLSKTRLGQDNSLLTFLVVGMNATMLMTKVRLAATLYCAWPCIHIDMVPFFAVAVAHIAGLHFGKGVFFCLLGWQSISFAMLWQGTISKICHVLNIPFLGEVPHKKD